MLEGQCFLTLGHLCCKYKTMEILFFNMDGLILQLDLPCPLSCH